jgi:transposase
MVVKTDRKDARGIAQLIRMGWFRAVHAKSASSQEIRALLTARRLLLDKLRDVELSLRGFGLKLGKMTQRGFETRARELVANHPMLQQITDRYSWRARRCSASTICSTRRFSKSYAATRSARNL